MNVNLVTKLRSVSGCCVISGKFMFTNDIVHELIEYVVLA